MAVVVTPVWAWGVWGVFVAFGVCRVCVLVCCVVGSGLSHSLWPWCVCPHSCPGARDLTVVWG